MCGDVGGEDSWGRMGLVMRCGCFNGMCHEKMPLAVALERVLYVSQSPTVAPHCWIHTPIPFHHPSNLRPKITAHFERYMSGILDRN